MEAERDALNDRPGELADADKPESAWTEDARRKVALLSASEISLREQLDARLEATREAGVVLGLDRLVQQHALDEVDRLVLLLTVMPACGLELTEVLGSVGSFGFAIMSITPELVAVFCEMNLAGRLQLRERLGERGPIVRAGIIDVDLPMGGERVQDWPTGSLYVEQAAFEVIVGIEGTATAASCPSCGQVVNGPQYH